MMIPTPLPDPRSPRQPDGVHEHSQVWEPHSGDWTDGDWAGRSVQGAVIYELHIGTFTPTGTFDAAIDKLDYLVDLGVDFVEVMPVNAFSGTHGWGYDGVLWYAVHEPYGGPDGLIRFVDACHRRGLGVLIDAVFNHLGPSGNYLPRFGPYLSSASNPWGEGINIADAQSDEVRRYIIDCALRWMRDFHADGLRLDAVHALFDTTAIHILEELAAETDALAEQLGRPLSLIAESDLNDPRMITPRPEHGHGHDRAVGRRHPPCHPHRGVRRAPGLLRRLRLAGDLGKDVAPRLLPRRHLLVVPPAAARPAAWTPPRPRGFRRPGCWPTPAPMTRSATVRSATGPSQNLSYGQLAVKAALVLASPYTAMLFMGEEWGASTPFQFFSSHPEPELARATAEGRKREFADHGWDADDIPDPQDPQTFQRSKLDWSELGSVEHAKLLRVYQELIALRRNESDLSDPWLDNLGVDYDEAGHWIALRRGRVTLACNLGADPVPVPFTGELVLGSEPISIGEQSTELPVAFVCDPARCG